MLHISKFHVSTPDNLSVCHVPATRQFQFFTPVITQVVTITLSRSPITTNAIYTNMSIDERQWRWRKGKGEKIEIGMSRGRDKQVDYLTCWRGI